MNEKIEQRMLELLADKALFSLTNEESAELSKLQKQFPEQANSQSFEITAAAIALADLDYNAQLPAYLKEKLSVKADEIFGESKQAIAPKLAPKFAEPAAQTVRQFEAEPKPFGWQWLGWAFAALALVALGVNVWTTRVKSDNEIVANQPIAATPTPEPNISEKREQLLALEKDIIKTDWKSPTDENKILGDIIWSNSKQTGYVRFNNLPVNDADKETYQLWIVDAARNEKTPVSAGVFNVAKSGEIIIPIDASLKIKSPKMFAVTKEVPGGVMVSKQENLVAVGKI